MEAPDKIYIQRFNVSEEDAKFERVLYFDDIWTEEPEPGCENVEYTRTDTFIENAFEFFGEHLWEYIGVKNANCDTFINIDCDKLNEDFKNYMKGE
jgi:hypothetical protein